MSELVEALARVVGATVTEALARVASIGDWDTAGPAPHPDIVDVVPPLHPCWDNGWWIHAAQRPAHPSRIGGPISAFAIVDHTTDMLPDELDPLTVALTTKTGQGNCLHFAIGRTPEQGVLQFVPINRNANHAGGDPRTHGWFVDDRGRKYHPNLVTIGIELHCAGGVRKVDGKWRLVEDGKAHGAALDDSAVIPDPQRPGRGWHRVTDYQYERLTALHNDLELVLAPLPPGLRPVSVVEPAPAWAALKDSRIVGHVNLDTARRSDPWPPTMQWLRNR